MKAYGQARKPAAFTQGENPQLSIENEAVWAPSQSGYIGEETIHFPVPEMNHESWNCNP